MTRDVYESYTVAELRAMLSDLGGAPGNKKKAELIDEIIEIRNGKIEAIRSNRGRKTTKQKRYSDYDFSLPTQDFYFADGGVKTPIGVEGVVDIDVYGGYLRGQTYLPSKSDVFIQLYDVENYHLNQGDMVKGIAAVRPPKNRLQLLTVESVNGKAPRTQRPQSLESYKIRPKTRKIEIDYGNNSALKTADMFCPLLKGRRELFVAPENGVKVRYFADLLKSIKPSENLKIICATIDETPEDVAVIEEAVGDNEFVYTTFEKTPEEHVKVAETVFSRAKALCEDGFDTLLIFESVTKLVKAYTESEKLLGEGGKQSLALAILKAKKLLSYARELGDRSLTIIITSRNETAFEKTVCDEISSVCNGKVQLYRQVQKKPSFLPIDITASGCPSCEECSSVEDYHVIEKIQQTVSKNPEKNEEAVSLLAKHVFDDDLIDRLDNL